MVEVNPPDLRPRTVTGVALAEITAFLGLPAAEGTVTGLTLDSRSVRPGDLYAALPGARTHGARFADQALAHGAAAVLTDPLGASMLGRCAVPVVVVEDPRSWLGQTAAVVYGHPAEALLTIGVTGTNGKTTTTYLIEAGLAAAGGVTGLIGTTGTRIAGRSVPTARTTPEAPDLHAIFARMVEEGVTAVAMEVSSHALTLGRVDGIRFDVAVFTNLSPDHLDFHEGMEDYFAAKASLFTPPRARRAVVCVDDPWGRRLAAGTAIPTTTYGVDTRADWTADHVTTSATGSRFLARGPGGGTELGVRLPGRFNVANALGALAALDAAGLPAEQVAPGIEASAGVPGRMQVVPDPRSDRAVIVDYAHTPDAVHRALVAVRQVTQGRIVCVLGCGGDRDALKRPEMGRIAAELSDVLIITDDNPRSEDPAQIRDAVRRGARTVPGATVREMGSRSEAIGAAIAAAGAGDAVVILGKGHETGQEIAGVVHPFDDREVAAQRLAVRP